MTPNGEVAESEVLVGIMPPQEEKEEVPQLLAFPEESVEIHGELMEAQIDAQMEPANPSAPISPLVEVDDTFRYEELLDIRTEEDSGTALENLVVGEHGVEEGGEDLVSAIDNDDTQLDSDRAFENPVADEHGVEEGGKGLVPAVNDDDTQFDSDASFENPVVDEHGSVEGCKDLESVVDDKDAQLDSGAAFENPVVGELGLEEGGENSVSVVHDEDAQLDSGTALENPVVDEHVVEDGGEDLVSVVDDEDTQLDKRDGQDSVSSTSPPEPWAKLQEVIDEIGPDIMGGSSNADEYMPAPASEPHQRSRLSPLKHRASKVAQVATVVGRKNLKQIHAHTQAGWEAARTKLSAVSTQTSQSWEQFIADLKERQLASEGFSEVQRKDALTGLIVARGSVYTLPYLVKEGQKISWKFRVKERDIRFTCRIRKQVAGGAIEEDLFPTERYNAGETYEGSWTAPEITRIILVWDNSYSFVRSKTIAYGVQLELEVIAPVHQELEQQSSDYFTPKSTTVDEGHLSFFATPLGADAHEQGVAV
jgi:hypothetical protein